MSTVLFKHCVYGTITKQINIYIYQNTSFPSPKRVLHVVPSTHISSSIRIGDVACGLVVGMIASSLSLSLSGFVYMIRLCCVY